MAMAMAIVNSLLQVRPDLQESMAEDSEVRSMSADGLRQASRCQQPCDDGGEGCLRHTNELNP